MLQIDNVVEDRLASPPGRLASRPWLAWLLVLLPFLLLALWRATQGAGQDSDDYGQYLMHAQALAEGRPYGDIGYIYSPYAPWIGPRMAPPGLPATLAPFMAVFGTNMMVLKGVMLFFATMFVALAGFYFARHDDRRMGLGVALLCGLSPLIIHNASQTLTDLPFAALVWALIYIVDRPGAFSWQRIAGITVLGAYAVAFRPTGLALVMALVLFAFVRYRQHGLRPAIPVLIWVAGLALLSIVMDIDRAAVISVNPMAVFEWVFQEKQPLINLSAYASALVASHLYPFPWAAANDAFHVLTVTLMVIGIAVWLPKAHNRFAVSFALSYALMLLIMPLNHPRYLWPLYPVLIFGLLNGVRTVVSAVAKRPAWGYAGAFAFAVALVPPAAMHVVTEPRPIDLSDVPDVSQVFQYVEQLNRTEPLRVTFFKPRTIAWQTGVSAMGPLAGEPVCILAELRDKEITHVIVGSLGGQRNSGLRQVINRWPSRFNKEFENGSFTVYRFNRSSAEFPKDLKDC